MEVEEEAAGIDELPSPEETQGDPAWLDVNSAEVLADLAEKEDDPVCLERVLEAADEAPTALCSLGADSALESEEEGVEAVDGFDVLDVPT